MSLDSFSLRYVSCSYLRRRLCNSAIRRYIPFSICLYSSMHSDLSRINSLQQHSHKQYVKLKYDRQYIFTKQKKTRFIPEVDCSAVSVDFRGNFIQSAQNTINVNIRSQSPDNTPLIKYATENLVCYLGSGCITINFVLAWNLQQIGRAHV